MAVGWIKIHRSIAEHWVFNTSEKSYGEAWIDLLILASYEPSSIHIANELIKVERGDIVTSLLKLQSRWNRGRKWVNNFLRKLEKDEMIYQKRNTRFTRITVRNYSDFQGEVQRVVHTEEHTVVHTEEHTVVHTEEQQRNMRGNYNKEDKEINNLRSKEKNLCRVSPETQLASSSPKNLIPKKKSATLEQIREVFSYWCGAMDSPRSRLDKPRENKIRDRLNDGYLVEELNQATDGCRNSQWHMGSNERNTKYNSITLIFRNADYVDKFISFVTNPPRIGGGQSLAQTAAEAIEKAAMLKMILGDDEDEPEGLPEL